MSQPTYGKPFKTIPQQRQLLESRGMAIADPLDAERWLDTVGYYRLSGYWYPFRVRSRSNTGPPVIEDRFQPGTSFQQVLDL
ncbi:MAG: Abi family protein [Rhodococcus sp. (in: high G+C Gram-positive bacteria)]|uniref:Abi family protein n=1 Tax=Rhodococcus sp. TaxID=1831 RepID=UPI003BAEB4DB